MDQDQIDAIRMAVSGQTEEPVTLETTGTHEIGDEDDGLIADEHHDQPPAQLLVSPDEIVQELAAHDVILLELMASRAALKRLTGHDAHQG